MTSTSTRPEAEYVAIWRGASLMRGGGGGALPKSDRGTVGGRLGLRRRVGSSAAGAAGAPLTGGPLIVRRLRRPHYAATAPRTASRTPTGRSCATVVLPRPVLSPQRKRAPALFLSLAAASSRRSGVAAERS